MSRGPAIRTERQPCCAGGACGWWATVHRVVGAELMSTEEFLIPLDEGMLEYFREMVDVLVEHCGISRAEAVARINERYGQKEMSVLEQNLMTHEFPEFWAYGVYYLPDDEYRLPTGDADADAGIDFEQLPVRPAPPRDSPVWTLPDELGD